jgi:hypothetical protein
MWSTTAQIKRATTIHMLDGYDDKVSKLEELRIS